jgi:hypothetical protein
MSNTQLHNLLSFLVRQADAHGLSEIRISTARARTILADLKPSKPAPAKAEPSYFRKLDKAFGI